MSELSQTIRREIVAVIEGTKSHADFKDFYTRMESTVKSIRNSDNLDKEDGTLFKLAQLLAENSDLLKDGAFVRRFK